jgi:riboflavin-specific deaminase-like protein
MSADGKIATADRSHAAISSRLDRDRLDAMRSESDAVLIGAATLRAEDPPLQVRDPARRRARRDRGLDELLTVVVLTRSCRLPATSRFFRDPAKERVVLTTEDAVRADEVARRGVTLLRHGHRSVDLAGGLAVLKERGVDRLLLEGGGAANAAFAAGDLIDELRLTLCPLLVGGAVAPTPLDGEGFPADRFPRMRLESVERNGDELFLRYVFAH